MKENENKETVKKSVSVLAALVRKIRAKFERDLASMRRVVLKWDECVFDKLSKIGSIEVSAVPPYEEKGDPLTVACKHSSTRFTSLGVFYYCPRSIALDSETGNVYICDSMNDRIQVLTKNLEFLFDFKKKMDWPASICINHSKVGIQTFRDETFRDKTFRDKMGTPIFYNCCGKAKS